MKKQKIDILVSHRPIFKVLEKGEITFTDLALYSKIHKSTLSDAVIKYCNQGLIEKRLDENDKRIVYLKLSEEGYKKCLIMNEIRDELISKVFKGFEKEQIQRFKKELHLMIENLNEE